MEVNSITVEFKNEVLDKLIAMPCDVARVLNPKDTATRMAIEYIIENDQVPGHEIEFNETCNKIKKRSRETFKPKIEILK